MRSVVLETFLDSSKWFATTKWFIVAFSDSFFLVLNDKKCMLGVWLSTTLSGLKFFELVLCNYAEYQ